MQTTSQVTPMMTLPGNSQSDKAILSLFLSDTEESEFSNFWAEKNWFIASTAFWHFLLHLFGLRSSCTFYLLLSVCERMSEWMSYALPLFAAPVLVLSCYLQFASVSLCLIGCMCLIDVWSAVVVVFLREGCTLRAVLPFRLEITEFHVCSKKCATVLQWMPAQWGVAGNEQSDRLAKEGGRPAQHMPSLSRWLLFYSFARTLGEGLMIHSPPVLFFFFLVEIKLMHTESIFGGLDQSTVAQQVEMTVAKCFLTSCLWVCFLDRFLLYAWTT